MVIRRPRQLVAAHSVVDYLPAVAGVGVGQVIHRPKLLGRRARSVGRQPVPLERQNVAVLIAAQPGQGEMLLLGTLDAGRVLGHVVAEQQPVSPVVAVCPRHPIVLTPPLLPHNIAVVELGLEPAQSQLSFSSPQAPTIFDY